MSILQPSLFSNNELPEPVAETIVDFNESTIDDVINSDDPEFLLDVSMSEMPTGQMAFIDDDEWWKVEWQGMPEYVQDDTTPWKSLYVHFRCREDYDEFGRVMQQRLTSDTSSIWFPIEVRQVVYTKAYVDES